ncbi:serine protease [Polaribacter sp. Hel1_85]|uniref:S1 family peptidase n=1 Tax=Polaribacter sp. Hel1_85 TaxID=1250005 RepID=UPI00052D3C61|nr:serine protease [Polaribacter sp. Hel1_85]KGL58405.1 peptidase S1/S6 chymotrypsin/Hap [Polaribacter sp. Hel1_85]
MNIQTLHSKIYTVGRITPTGVKLLGTCFLINKSGLLATASHVTDNDPTNLVIFVSTNTDLTTYQDTSNNGGNTIPVNIFKVDPIRDICILKVNQNVLSDLVLGSSDDVNVSENLGVIGYPHCVNGRNVLTYQNTVLGAKVLIEASGIKSKHLILNIQTRPGQSGSPIFRLSDSRVVAMIIGSYVPNSNGRTSIGGIDPQTLHQTTHAVSVEYILNMI